MTLVFLTQEGVYEVIFVHLRTSARVQNFVAFIDWAWYCYRVAWNFSCNDIFEEVTAQKTKNKKVNNNKQTNKQTNKQQQQKQKQKQKQQQQQQQQQQYAAGRRIEIDNRNFRV